MTIDDPSGQTTTVTSTATVTTPSPRPVRHSRSRRASRCTQTVANFTDTNPATNASNITAVINWGDGQTSTGDDQLELGGTFTVTGTHIYSPTRRSVLRVKVTILDPSGQSATTNSTAIATPHQRNRYDLRHDGGKTFTPTVANFTDTNPTRPPRTSRP